MSDSHFNGPLAILIRRIISHAPPDPWPSSVDAAVRASDAIPLCIDCLYPQEGHRWFCPNCNYPTGDYVVLMHYLQIFPIGEILRRGVFGPPEKSSMLNAGFAFFAAAQYGIFAPIYWFWMIRKAQGRPICHAHRKALEFE